MKNLLTKLRYVPKRFGVVAAIIAATTTAALTFAWGPTRDTYTIAHPASKVTFNSIIDNPNIGDERNFVGIRESGTTGLWQDTQPVSAGKEYVVRMYVHNNAAANLNLVAENVTAKFNLPTTTGKSIQVNGFLNSTNASPVEVYDHAIFTSAKDFNLALVPGSIKYYNNANGNGFTIPESVFTSTGAKLGYSQMDGKIPGCFQYAGYLTFIVKPQFAPSATFTLKKEVRKNGASGWYETANVMPGDKVDYLISYDNTSDVPQDNVVIKDTLPAGVTLVNGTTYVYNSTNPGGVKVSDNIATGNGINIGNYAGHSAAYVKFTAQVAANNALPLCGLNTLKNVARATTDYGWKEDGANVTVTKTCTNPPTASCKAITPHVISRTEFSFDGEATVSNGATVSKYTFVVKNAAGTVVKTVPVSSTALKVNSGKITLTTAGKYSVVLTVTTSLGDKTSTNCQTTVEVKPEIVVPKYTCDEVTVTQISRTEFKFVAKKTVENATYLRTVFVVRTQSGTEVARFNDADGAYTYTRTAVGKYTVEVFIVVRVNGVDKTVTSAKCKKPFEVKAAAHPAVDIEKKVIDADGKLVDLRSVTVGTPFVYQIVVKNTGNVALKHVLVNDVAPDNVVFIKTDAGTITGTPEGKAWSIYVDLAVNESRTFKITAKVKTYVENQIVNTACVNAPEVNPTHPDQSDDCDRANVVVPKPTMIKVCVLGTWEIKDIKQADFDATKHSKNLSDCTTKVCELSTKKIVVINKRDFDQSKFSTKLSDCDTTTTPPIVIANTGTEMIAAGGLLGSSALGLGISSFMRSRSAVKSALSRR